MRPIERKVLGKIKEKGITMDDVLEELFGEIAALSTGNFQIVPEVVTVIEMGGEDSKLLILDSTKRLISDFAMNASASTTSKVMCAAGMVR